MGNKIVKLKLLNEVDVAIIGLNPREHDILSDMFALKTSDYYFNPKFVAKVWDGFNRFVSKTGKTFINLLPRIIPVLKDLGYKVEIIDTRDNLKIKVPLIDENYLAAYKWEETGKPVILAPHQVGLINAITTNNGCMIKAGTGAGKTLCCWVLHHLYHTYCGFETLIIVPTKDLIYQTVAELNNFSDDVGMWGDGKKDTNHPVVVSTWQTLQKEPAFVGKFKHIIMDECHGNKNFASQVNVILNKFGKNCYVKTGMTGTFPEHPCDLRTLECAMGQIQYEVSARELIDIGWLAELNLNMMLLNEDFKDEYKEYLIEWQADVDAELKKNPDGKKIKKPTYTQYKKMLFPEYPHETKYLRKNDARNEFIANFVISKADSMESGNSVILVNTKEHGKALEALIPNSKCIFGTNVSKVRKAMFELFSSSDDVTMITTYGLAAVGLNIKRIFNIYMVDPGKSFIRVIQTIGRGLRKAHDKDIVNVYDIHSNLHYNATHKRKRVKFYKSEEHPIANTYKINYR